MDLQLALPSREQFPPAGLGNAPHASLRLPSGTLSASRRAKTPCFTFDSPEHSPRRDWGLMWNASRVSFLASSECLSHGVKHSLVLSSIHHLVGR